MTAEIETEAPYWTKQVNVAPIKSEFVRWDVIDAGRKAKQALLDRDNFTTVDDAEEAAPFIAAPDDDAAEGEGRPAKKLKRDHVDERDAKGSNRDNPKEKKGKISKKERKLLRLKGSDGLCQFTARGKECHLLDDANRKCSYSHNLAEYLKTKSDDLSIPTKEAIENFSRDQTEAMPEERPPCPAFLSLGICPQGFKCRHIDSHIRFVPEREGILGSNAELVFDEPKMRQALLAVFRNDQAKVDALPFEEVRNLLYQNKGEMNLVGSAGQRFYRGKRAEAYPKSYAYFTAKGEQWEREDTGRGGRGGRGGKRGRGGKKGNATSREVAERKAEDPVKAAPADENEDVKMETELSADKPLDEVEAVQESKAPLPVEPSNPEKEELKAEEPLVIIDEQTKDSSKPDRACIAPREKKRLDFRDKLYLAPLTTTGNLPFRRLCVNYGADITCSEMAVASEFITGNPSEWSLVRRHPSEKMYGVQLCGSRPMQLVPAAEAVLAACPDVDFLDINCGCPIDLIFNKGAGSALLEHANKLGNSLAGLNAIMGETPLTIKLRMGVKDNTPVAHKLIPRLAQEWGVSGLTLHGRSRAQRYSRAADYQYIARCVQALRSTEEEHGLLRTPMLGNGDAYDQSVYWNTIEKTGVDAIMVARGALIKPWIFTELREKRDWDISARERLDGIESLAKMGLQHWGADTSGIATTRRFMCEALSFQYRYVPIGILDHLPAHMVDRPLAYKGRNELETLLASDDSADWIKLTEFYLGKDDSFKFTAKHKSNSYERDADAMG